MIHALIMTGEVSALSDPSNSNCEALHCRTRTKQKHAAECKDRSRLYAACTRGSYVCTCVSCTSRGRCPRRFEFHFMFSTNPHAALCMDA